MTTATSPADALAERLTGATLGALELVSVHLGAELGMYGSLAQHGPQTADEPAGTAGIAKRYARGGSGGDTYHAGNPSFLTNVEFRGEDGVDTAGYAGSAARWAAGVCGSATTAWATDGRFGLDTDNVGLRFEEFETSSGDYASRVYIAADGVEFLASRRRDGSQAENGEGPDGATGRAAQRRRR